MKKKQPAASGTGLREQVQALDAYLTRIGAEELNFRRFMVKEYRKGKNYYVEKTLIRINPDGTISCSRSEHEPTAEEKKAIAEGLKGFEFPKSIGVAVRAAQKKADEIGGEVYLFHDRGRGDVKMLQQKFITQDGQKVYVAHTFWSDGIWRKMEPDGALPFWKPATGKRTPLGLKMIHEGAKAASFVTDLLGDPKRLAEHPWGATLSRYEHWGMIGGALAPHRSDYDELRSEKPTEVVYVCDNDHSGESALEIVSRHYGESMRGIKFGNSFKTSWDMADPIPRSLFSSSGRYVGSPLVDFMQPATWATEMIAVPGTKGRHRATMRRAFLEEWIHSVRPEVYLHKDWANNMLTSSEFNNFIRPFSDLDDTSRLLKGAGVSKTAVIKYDPSRPSGMYEDKAGRFINTHMETEVVTEKGDTKPFTDFMDHLVTNDEDRIELSRWCATLIARPAVKMSYGVLLISETQGVGKGTLGEKILAPLVGKFNVSYPSENEIVESQFNQWLAHKRLAVVHEIYAGQSSKAYNRLKSTITDRSVSVNRKHMAPYDIDNWIHIFACSNSMRAIRLSMDDRRWYLPKITDKKKSKEYWIGFNDWLRNQGGLGIIKYWAEEFLKTHSPVVEGEESPWSSVKKEVVEDGYSQGQTLVAEVLDKIRTILSSEDEDDVKMREEWRGKGMMVNGESVILLDTELIKLITDVVHQGRQSDKLEKPLTIRKLAKGLGWHIGNQSVSTGMKTWGAGACSGRVISNDAELASTPPALLGGKTAEREGRTPIRPLDLSWAKVM
jgi:hypothetical protein